MVCCNIERGTNNKECVRDRRQEWPGCAVSLTRLSEFLLSKKGVHNLTFQKESYLDDCVFGFLEEPHLDNYVFGLLKEPTQDNCVFGLLKEPHLDNCVFGLLCSTYSVLPIRVNMQDFQILGRSQSSWRKGRADVQNSS